MAGLLAVFLWHRGSAGATAAKISILQPEGAALSLPVGARGHIRYQVLNGTNDAIVLQRIVPSCGCAKATTARTRLGPGEITPLIVGFTPSQREEIRTISVAMVWVAEKARSTEQTVEVITNVTFVAPFSQSPKELAFDFSREERAVKSSEITVWRGLQNLQWDELRPESTDLNVSVKSPVAVEKKFLVKVEVDPSKSPLGVSSASVKLRAFLHGVAVSERVEIPIQISVASDISIDPGSVYFGPVRRQSTATRILHITNLKDKPDLEVEIDPQSRDVIKTEIARDGEGWALKVDLTPQQSGPGQTNMTVYLRNKGRQRFHIPMIWYGAES